MDTSCAGAIAAAADLTNGARHDCNDSAANLTHWAFVYP